MQAKIIPELLIKNLRNVPSRKPDDHCEKLEKISPGAEYLYRTVILPKMQGKEVSTDEVNMSAFDLEDIEIICDYYKYNVAADRPETKPLFELYSKISDTPPLNSHSDFI